MDTHGGPRDADPAAASDDGWALVVPYLMLMTESAPQRHPLRDDG